MRQTIRIDRHEHDRYHDARNRIDRERKPLKRIVICASEEEAEQERAAHSRLFRVGIVVKIPAPIGVSFDVNLWAFACFAPEHVEPVDFAVNPCTSCGSRRFRDDTCLDCGAAR